MLRCILEHANARDVLNLTLVAAKASQVNVLEWLHAQKERFLFDHVRKIAQKITKSTSFMHSL